MPKQTNPFFSVKAPHKRSNAFGFTEEEMEKIKPGSDQKKQIKKEYLTPRMPSIQECQEDLSIILRKKTELLISRRKIETKMPKHEASPAENRSNSHQNSDYNFDYSSEADSELSDEIAAEHSSKS